jgi:hypothetical protein
MRSCLYVRKGRPTNWERAIKCKNLNHSIAIIVSSQGLKLDFLFCIAVAAATATIQNVITHNTITIFAVFLFMHTCVYWLYIHMHTYTYLRSVSPLSCSLLTNSKTLKFSKHTSNVYICKVSLHHCLKKDEFLSSPSLYCGVHDVDVS